MSLIFSCSTSVNKVVTNWWVKDLKKSVANTKNSQILVAKNQEKYNFFFLSHGVFFPSGLKIYKHFCIAGEFFSGTITDKIDVDHEITFKVQCKKFLKLTIFFR